MGPSAGPVAVPGADTWVEAPRFDGTDRVPSRLYIFFFASPAGVAVAPRLARKSARMLGMEEAYRESGDGPVAGGVRMGSRAGAIFLTPRA